MQWLQCTPMTKSYSELGTRKRHRLVPGPTKPPQNSNFIPKHCNVRCGDAALDKEDSTVQERVRGFVEKDFSLEREVSGE